MNCLSSHLKLQIFRGRRLLTVGLEVSAARESVFCTYIQLYKPLHSEYPFFLLVSNEVRTPLRSHGTRDSVDNRCLVAPAVPSPVIGAQELHRKCFYQSFLECHIYFDRIVSLGKFYV